MNKVPRTRVMRSPYSVLDFIDFYWWAAERGKMGLTSGVRRYAGKYIPELELGLFMVGAGA